MIGSSSLGGCSGETMGDPAGCSSGCQWGQVAEERGNSATNTACPAHIKDAQLARFYRKENYIKEINVKKMPFLLVY